MEFENAKLLLKVIIGSQAYGTSTTESDVDHKGIYAQDIDQILLGKYIPQIEVSKDEVYYEINRFLELLMKNNPTILEILNVPEECIVYRHPILDELYQKKDLFISKICKDSFGGYAVSQIKKAEGTDKMMNWEQGRVERKTITDFCHVVIPSVIGAIPLKKFCEIHQVDFSQLALSGLQNFSNGYQLFVDKEKTYTRGIVSSGERESNELRLCSIPKEAVSIGVLHYHKDGYVQHCKEYNKYQAWLKNRNEQRFVDVKEHDQKIDGKNMLHNIRLTRMALEIAQGKGIIVKRPDAEYLLSIRKGSMNLKELIKESTELLKEMSATFETSDLPERPDPTLKDTILLNIRNHQKKS